MAIFPYLKHVQILNQISKVNTKSTNLNGTYRTRSVFQHLPKSTARTTTYHQPRIKEKIRHINSSFFLQKFKKQKVFFSRRLISVKFRFRKKKKNYLRGISFSIFGEEINNFFFSNTNKFFFVVLKNNLFNFFY